MGIAHWALGSGHWAFGIGHSALGIAHWAWGEGETMVSGDPATGESSSPSLLVSRFPLILGPLVNVDKSVPYGSDRIAR